MINFSTQNKESDEVYLSNEKFISISNSDIDRLIKLSINTKRQRVRYCIHPTPSESVHEMFITHPKGAYVRPHKHLNKPESMMIIEGEADYVVFDGEGNIKEKISMGSYQSGKPFYQSTRVDAFHSLVIHSEWLVFLEVTQGPFNIEDTVFAKWSPMESAGEKNKKFMRKVEEGV